MQKINTKAKNITVNRIFRLIRENKLTAKEFAKSCSIHQGNITDWKSGRSRPSVNALRKIARKYNVQLEWLTGDCKFKTKKEEFKSMKGEKESE